MSIPNETEKKLRPKTRFVKNTDCKTIKLHTCLFLLTISLFLELERKNANRSKIIRVKILDMAAFDMELSLN